MQIYSFSESKPQEITFKITFSKFFFLLKRNKILILKATKYYFWAIF